MEGPPMTSVHITWPSLLTWEVRNCGCWTRFIAILEFPLWLSWWRTWYGCKLCYIEVTDVTSGPLLSWLWHKPHPFGRTVAGEFLLDQHIFVGKTEWKRRNLDVWTVCLSFYTWCLIPAWTEEEGHESPGSCWFQLLSASHGGLFAMWVRW